MGTGPRAREAARQRKTTTPNALGAAIAAWNNKARESATPILTHIHAGIRALHQARADLRHYGDMHPDHFSPAFQAPSSAASDPVRVVRTLCARLDAFEEALQQVRSLAEATRAQGETLVREYGALLARPDHAGRAHAAHAPSHGNPENDEDGGAFSATRALEQLVEAQQAEIAALNALLVEMREKLAARTGGGQRGQTRDIPYVEIQSVQDFVQNARIGTVPVNASYYERILEAATAPEGHRVPMGEILTSAGIITLRQLDNALAHQQNVRRQPLGKLLVDLGYTTEQAIAQAVAAQLDLPYILLAREHIRSGAAALVPLRMARRHIAFPIDHSDHFLTVAMANPLDLVALEDLHKTSNRHIRPCVATREDILLHIRIHYG